MERGETLFSIRRDGQPACQTTGREYSQQDGLIICFWRRFILRNVRDAAGRDLMLGKETEKLSTATRCEAQEWLVTDSPWLREVCSMGVVDADRLLKMTKGLYGALVGKRQKRREYMRLYRKREHNNAND